MWVLQGLSPGAGSGGSAQWEDGAGGHSSEGFVGLPLLWEHSR